MFANWTKVIFGDKDKKTKKVSDIKLGSNLIDFEDSYVSKNIAVSMNENFEIETLSEDDKVRSEMVKKWLSDPNANENCATSPYELFFCMYNEGLFVSVSDMILIAMKLFEDENRDLFNNHCLSLACAVGQEKCLKNLKDDMYPKPDLYAVYRALKNREKSVKSRFVEYVNIDGENREGLEIFVPMPWGTVCSVVMYWNENLVSY